MILSMSQYHSLTMRSFLQTIAEGKMITGDLGGKASTKEYAQAIIDKIHAAQK